MAFAVCPIIVEFASVCSLALAKSENLLNKRTSQSVVGNTCNPITQRLQSKVEGSFHYNGIVNR